MKKPTTTKAIKVTFAPEMPLIEMIADELFDYAKNRCRIFETPEQLVTFDGGIAFFAKKGASR